MNNFTKSLIPLAAAGTLVLPAAATASKAPALLMKCQSVSVRDTHGGAVRAHTQLTPIRRGRVLTLDPATGVTAQTPFRRSSGRWLTSRNGSRYAVANQWISRTGRPGGDLLIATPAGKLPCAARNQLAFKSDTASTTADGSLAGSGYLETAGSTTNVSDRPLENYATRTVWTNMPTHPDGAPRSPEDTTPGYPYGYTWRRPAARRPTTRQHGAPTASSSSTRTSPGCTRSGAAPYSRSSSPTRSPSPSWNGCPTRSPTSAPPNWCGPSSMPRSRWDRCREGKRALR